MKRVAYSPQVRLYIKTDRLPSIYNQDTVKLGGSHYFNVSKDIRSGDLTLNVDQVSAMNVTLSNQGNRYKDTFDRLDVVKLYFGYSEDNMIPVFTGIIESITEGIRRDESIRIVAHDNLKWLAINFFDPYIDTQITNNWKWMMPEEIMHMIMHMYTGDIFREEANHKIDKFAPELTARYKALLAMTAPTASSTGSGADIWNKPFRVTTNRISEFLLSYGSPFGDIGTVGSLVDICNIRGVHPALFVAISGIESTFGKHCFEPFNAWGWDRFQDYHSTFSSWVEAFDRVARDIAGYNGSSIDEISVTYCTSGPVDWAKEVKSFFNEISVGATVGPTVDNASTTSTANSLFPPLGDKTVFSGYAPGESSDHGPAGHGIFQGTSGKYTDAIDIGNSGEDCFAVFAGKVTVVRSHFFEDSGKYAGECVEIQNGTSFAYYAHMSSGVLVSVGDEVKKGQKIGTVYSDIGHLHFQLIVNDNPIVAGDMEKTIGSGTTSGFPPVTTDNITAMQLSQAVENQFSTILKIPLKYLNDTTVLSWIVPIGKWGRYCLTTDADGNFLARIPQFDYLDDAIIAQNPDGSKKSGKPVLTIEDISITDFSMTWADMNTYSNVYVMNDILSGYVGGAGTMSLNKQQVEENLWFIGATDVVNEAPNLDSFKKNYNSDNDRSVYVDPLTWINKFKVRPKVIAGEDTGWCNTIAATQFLAEYLFAEYWANQVTADIELTFLPQLRPLMNVYIPSKEMAFHVAGPVRHTFGTSGYTTSAEIINGRYYKPGDD